jgi:hypothetical protein
VEVSTCAEAPAERAVTNTVTIPAGSHLPIVLDDTVGSDMSRPEQPIHAHLSHALVVRGKTEGALIGTAAGAGGGTAVVVTTRAKRSA